MGFVDEVTAEVGAANVVTDPDVIAAHAHDRTALIGAGTAQALVRARTTEHVQATLRLATQHRVPVVTRGAGTGLSGASNATDGCIILSTAAMDQILDIDVAARTVRTQPGILNAQLAAEVAKHGLWYPPDPASREICSIGGNIATNAGGSCCLKYGVTTEYVAALTVVLADGTLMRTGAPTRKNVAGLDLTRLLVGSEGTLAVTVEATLRLRPAPRAATTLVGFFPTAADAGQAVVAMGAVADLSLVELMDRTTVLAVEKMTRMGLDTDAGTMLLCQSDSGQSSDIERAAEAALAAGASDVLTTDDPEEGEGLLAARRAAVPAMEKLDGAALLDDVGVPVPRVPQLITDIEAIAQRLGVTVGTFGHAGDGNLHPMIVYTPGNAASEELAMVAFGQIVEAAIALGGTVSGEHGIGTVKLSHLDGMIDPAARMMMHRIKAAFDPLGILNPGKSY